MLLDFLGTRSRQSAPPSSSQATARRPSTPSRPDEPIAAAAALPDVKEGSDPEDWAAWHAAVADLEGRIRALHRLDMSPELAAEALSSVKHPLLHCLGMDYPFYLERLHDHILRKVDELWGTPEIDGYLGDLLIDKRGGRKGFAPDAIKDINTLRELRWLETLRAAERKEAAIQELKRRGIDLSRSGFLAALERGDQEVVDLFVRSSFNVDVTAHDGTPALLLALKKGYTIIAKILLAAGADVHQRDRLGLTPLMVACGKSTAGYKEVAEALIKKGAEINVRDVLGFAPLSLALSGGAADIAELLIHKGADVSVRTRKGETPLFFAQRSRCTAIVDLLVRRGATC